jgi:hypothetical protein
LIVIIWAFRFARNDGFAGDGLVGVASQRGREPATLIGAKPRLAVMNFSKYLESESKISVLDITPAPRP